VPGAPRVPLPRPTAASDGKTVRGSATAAAPATHLLSLFAVQFGCILAQRAVAGKTNEIAVAPELLADFALEGWLVTTDALLTQRELDCLILARGGAYFHPVKGNQPRLLGDIQDLFSSPLLNDSVQTAVTNELVGNRIVQRAVNGAAALNAYSDWPRVGQVVEVWRVVTDKATKQVHSERAYAITSFGPGGMQPGANAGGVASALGDRKSAALGAGRDAGGGCQPGT
jgi:predicted transposase YbfD/YdcC